jgi:hypothetical protein
MRIPIYTHLITHRTGGQGLARFASTDPGYTRVYLDSPSQRRHDTEFVHICGDGGELILPMLPAPWPPAKYCVVHLFTVTRYACMRALLTVREWEPDPEYRDIRGEDNSNLGCFGKPRLRPPCDPQECERMVGVGHRHGGGLYQYFTDNRASPWTPFDEAVNDEVTETDCCAAITLAAKAGMWRQTEHSANKRYFELDRSAPATVTCYVVSSRQVTG